MGEIKKDKAWILFGAGDEGKRMARALEKTDNEVYGFADNNKSKVGTYVEGKKVISFEELMEIEKDYQIVIAVSKQYQNEIAKQLMAAGVGDFLFLEEAYSVVRYKSNPELKKYKNMFQGKRCFIIGTGPSLKVEDLETLQKHGEITIASNKIFKIYEQTKWRPDIYCATDSFVLQEYKEEILNLSVDISLLSSTVLENGTVWDEEKMSHIGLFRLVYKPYEDDEYPEFSALPDRYIIEGFTVTYAIMQWAAYMGFAEMYLIGIDFDYGDKETGYKHFISNYDRKDEKVKPPRLNKCLKAYEMAEDYSYKNGFRIFNATRGGKLEVFERVDFDSLFEDKE